MAAPPPALFSPLRRAAQLAQRRAPVGDDVVADLTAEALVDRLAMVTRRFARALLIAADGHALIPQVTAQVDHIDVVPDIAAATGTYELIIWPGGLESINDVPGALVRARHALSPDGLLIGALVGDGSFPLLRRLLASEGMRAIPRMHPQIDLKSFGNLLQRAGFALPVVDVEATVLRYRHWHGLVRDMRRAGLASQLAAAPPPIQRRELAALDAAFAAACDGANTPDGRADEALRLIFFTAWAPHESQPQPARRGSGKRSLAAALRAIDPAGD